MIKLKNIPTFVINLDGKQNRYQRTRDIFKQDLPLIQRKPAVNGRSLNDDTIRKALSFRTYYQRKQPISVLNMKLIRSPGEIGCWLSHIEIWQKMVEESIPMAIVFEDDVIKGKQYDPIRLQNAINEALQNHPQLTMLVLGTSPTKKVRYHKLESGLHQLLGFSGTWAYLITLEGASKLLEKSLPLEVPIDVFLGQLTEVDNLMILRHPDTRKSFKVLMNDTSTTISFDIYHCFDCHWYYGMWYIIGFFVVIFLLFIVLCLKHAR